MYGFLLQSVSTYLQQRLGEKAYEEVLKIAGINVKVFNTHDNYPDAYIPALARAASDVARDGSTTEDFLEMFGRMFVQVRRVITSVMCLLYDMCLFIRPQYCHLYGHYKVRPLFS